MKKILLICKETYSYPMNFVKDELVALGYEVEALFIHSSESLYRDNSLVKFVERNSDIKVHTLSELCVKYMNNVSRVDELVDYKYLESVEKKYCSDLPLSLLQISSQLFTTAYHYRFFFKHMSENEKLYWMQLLFKYAENLLAVGQYDKICDLDIAEIGRSVLFQVSKGKNIPYVSIEFSRFDGYVLPTFTLGKKTDGYFVDYCSQSASDVGEEFVQCVDGFRAQENILAGDFKYNETSKKNKRPIEEDLKRLVFQAREVCRRFPKWLKYKRIPLLAQPHKVFIFFVLWFVRERILFNRLFTPFEVPDPNDKYVYFPLHLIPESTTLNKSPFYPNELSVIEAVSKSLPVGWKLYVKEHGAMIGERPLYFYRKIKRLTNIKLVDVSYYQDPKPWITNSMGVITLSGTSAFEAAMLNVPAIMFGNTFFENIDGIKKLNNIQDLPREIAAFDCENRSDNKMSVALYIQAVKHFGQQVRVLWMINEGAKIVNGGEPATIEIKEEARKLVKIFGLDR